MKVGGLYAIVDPSAVLGCPPDQLALEYLQGGVPILQLRDKRREETLRARRLFRDAAIKIGAKVVWMQEGVVNEGSAQKGRAAGLTVVMDQCMMKEHKKLFKLVA